MIPPYPVDRHREAWTASCPACRHRTAKKGSPDKARRALHDHVTAVHPDLEGAPA